MTRYFSRARLKRSASITAMAKLLLPDPPGQRVQASHRLVWSLFAGDPDQKRDFLWREDQAGTFYILSARPPGPSEVLDTDTKEFAPSLAAGDRLRFTLRANATTSWGKQPGGRGRRADVVMAALHATEKPERIAERPLKVIEAGGAWLRAQGAAHGFSPAAEIVVDGYGRLRVPRAGKDMNVNTLDFAGVLEVDDPAPFLAKLISGFGRARAFGCGLMLIRRA